MLQSSCVFLMEKLERLRANMAAEYNDSSFCNEASTASAATTNPFSIPCATSSAVLSKHDKVEQLW